MILAAATPAFAQSPAGTASSPGDQQAMMGSMQKMQAAMAAVPMTSNTDQDFAAMMIPHHQGAVDMARIELQSGRSTVLRKMARNIIAAQEREIKEFHAWQRSHPRR